MNQIVFYEKSGCLGNARQKSLLRSEGFELDVRSILDTPWEPETLKPFLDKRAIPDWFNTTAPDVKNGIVDPASVGETEALNLMVINPILIRRPLIEYNGDRFCGFDESVSSQILNQQDSPVDIESCQSIAPEEKCD